ncbi:MAG: endonuclease III domain-containing protein [Promethearchaeota archaeon]
MGMIKELVEKGEFKLIFAPLIATFPQSFRYVSNNILNAIWDDVKERLERMGIETNGRDRQDVIREASSADPVQLASEIDNEPFKTLIRTILSARSKDEQTIKVSNALFDEYHFDTADKLARADENVIKEIIRPIGFYNTKSKYIINTSKAIIEQYGGKVPKNFKDLVSLPGVGSKVANCVLVYAFKIPAIPVDTHVHRIVNRWGLVETTDPEKTNKLLMQVLPREWWILINDLLVRFGKEICKPIAPRCGECPLERSCPKLIKKKGGKKKAKAREPAAGGGN